MRYTLLASLLALIGCGESTTTPPPPTPEPPPDEAPAPPDLTTVDFDPGPARMRRLTANQYAAVVTDLFGPDVVPPARLEPDSRTAGSLALGATVTTVSPRGVELYVDGAAALAGQVLAPERRDRWVRCTPDATVDDACARDTLRALGRRAWRRPLADDELDRLVTVSARAAEVLDDFHAGLEYGVAALLASPAFVYRVELGDADGALDPYAMASRLSFFFWNTGPDDALLDAAADGALDTPAGLRGEAERLAADPRVEAGVRAFFADLLELDRLGAMTKAPELFPHFDETLGPAAREETLAGLVTLVVDERGDYRDVMTTRRAVVDPKLASLYTVRAPARRGFAEVWLPEDGPRLGLLGQASTLALHSHPVSTSATLRGMFVRETLLCQTMPDPPAGVDTSIPEPSGDAPTLRDRVGEHLEAPECAGCHTLMDPIGLALEHFDGIGRYRPTDNGATIDPSGTLDGVPFDGPEGLAHAIREHPAFGPCLVERLYRYALGRVPERGEDAMLDALAQRFSHDGYDVLGLMVELAASPAFRRVGLDDTTDSEGEGTR